MMINEAMMSGTPVIAFKMGVAEDLIEEGETGFIATMVNEESLSEAIGKFIALAPEERSIMGRNCRSRALALSTCEVQVAKFLQLARTAAPNPPTLP